MGTNVRANCSLCHIQEHNLVQQRHLSYLILSSLSLFATSTCLDNRLDGPGSNSCGGQDISLLQKTQTGSGELPSQWVLDSFTGVKVSTA